MKAWSKKTITNDNGISVETVMPEIISASRSTDIPAFYSKWFFNRLEKGHLAWINPFNRQLQYISFDKTRLIVFWTKNPKPIIEKLNQLDERGIGYYFQYTINDYEKEGFEPNVAPLDKRIETFINLSKKIGKEKVIWRFDPLLLTEKLTMDELIERVEGIGNELVGYTEKLVFSFADINIYRKVINNLKRTESAPREFSNDEILYFARDLSRLNQKWRFNLATCAEPVQLKPYGIEHNRCIDDELIAKIFGHDSKLMEFIGYRPSFQGSLFEEKEYNPNPKLKDKGQREACGCIFSKDIGMYNTCMHLCKYCYANTSDVTAEKNYQSHDPNTETIINIPKD